MEAPSGLILSFFFCWISGPPKKQILPPPSAPTCRHSFRSERFFIAQINGAGVGGRGGWGCHHQADATEKNQKKRLIGLGNAADTRLLREGLKRSTTPPPLVRPRIQRALLLTTSSKPDDGRRSWTWSDSTGGDGVQESAVPLPWLMRKSAAVPFTWRRRAARTQLLTHTPPPHPKHHTERLCLQRHPARVYRGGWRRRDSSASTPWRARGPRSPS